MKTNIDTGYEISKFVLAIGIIIAIMIGIWAFVCMISVIINGGLPEVIKGLLTAVTGT